MYYCLDNEHLPKITNIGRNVTPSDWKHFSRNNTEYVMYFINDGKMYIKENDEKYILERGDMLLLEPNKVHVGYKAHFCDFYYIHCKPSSFTIFDCSELNNIERIITQNRSEFYKSSALGDELYEKSKLFIPKDMKIHQGSVYNELTSKCEEAITYIYKRNQHCKLICSSKFIEILALLSDYFARERLNIIDDNTVKINQKVEAIIELIHQEYPNKMTSKYISKRLNFNFDYLNRIFKKQVGITIFKYLNNTRIDKAKELLLKGNMKSCEIALAVGFCDQYRFSKAFKQTVGIPPKKYIQG